MVDNNVLRCAARDRGLCLEEKAVVHLSLYLCGLAKFVIFERVVSVHVHFVFDVILQGFYAAAITKLGK